MGQYFALNYTGSPFQLYGAGHILALFLVILFCFSFLYFRTIWDDRQKKRFRHTLAWILFLNELAWHAWAAYWGVWNIQTMLPLHLCSVVVWLTIYMLITNSYKLYEISYFLGIGGATQALLTPDITGYGFPHFRAFNTFLAHGLLVAVPVYMTLVEGYRPTWHSFKRIFIWTNIYMVFVFFLNLALGSNYLFIAYKPNFPTLLDILAPWPWYIIELEAVAFLIFLLLYLPFFMKDLRIRSQSQANNQ